MYVCVCNGKPIALATPCFSLLVYPYTAAATTIGCMEEDPPSDDDDKVVKIAEGRDGDTTTPGVSETRMGICYAAGASFNTHARG